MWPRATATCSEPGRSTATTRRAPLRGAGPTSPRGGAGQRRARVARGQQAQDPLRVDVAHHGQQAALGRVHLRVQGDQRLARGLVQALQGGGRPAIGVVLVEQPGQPARRDGLGVDALVLVQLERAGALAGQLALREGGPKGDLVRQIQQGVQVRGLAGEGQVRLVQRDARAEPRAQMVEGLGELLGVVALRPVARDLGQQPGGPGGGRGEGGAPPTKGPTNLDQGQGGHGHRGQGQAPGQGGAVDLREGPGAGGVA